jgi:hypothetical protein
VSGEITDFSHEQGCPCLVFFVVITSFNSQWASRIITPTFLPESADDKSAFWVQKGTPTPSFLPWWYERGPNSSSSDLICNKTLTVKNKFDSTVNLAFSFQKLRDTGGTHTIGSVTVQVIIGWKANLPGPSHALISPPPCGPRWKPTTGNPPLWHRLSKLSHKRVFSTYPVTLKVRAGFFHVARRQSMRAGPKVVDPGK